MFTETGMVVALAHVLMPYMVLAVWAALQRLDPQVENAAVALGAGPFTVLRRIVLPQVMPGILSGAIIVFALAASAFATPAIIGGRRLKVAVDAGLRRIPEHAQLAAGGGRRGAAAGRSGRHRGRRQPAGRTALCAGVRMSRLS